MVIAIIIDYDGYDHTHTINIMQYCAIQNRLSKFLMMIVHCPLHL